MAKSEIRRFLQEIRTKFPDVVPLMEKHESWALTFLMEEFANLTTILLNQGDLEEALEHLLYMSEKLDTGGIRVHRCILYRALILERYQRRY